MGGGHRERVRLRTRSVLGRGFLSLTMTFPLQFSLMIKGQDWGWQQSGFGEKRLLKEKEV